jgi:hypothetical protein
MVVEAGTFTVHDTCRDESSPTCRRVSDTSRLQYGFPLVIVLFAFLGIKTVPVLPFFQALFYCLICRSSRLKASLPLPKRTRKIPYVIFMETSFLDHCSLTDTQRDSCLAPNTAPFSIVSKSLTENFVSFVAKFLD